MIGDPWDLDLGKFGTTQAPRFDDIWENFVCCLSFLQKKIGPRIVLG